MVTGGHPQYRCEFWLFTITRLLDNVKVTPLPPHSTSTKGQYVPSTSFSNINEC